MSDPDRTVLHVLRCAADEANYLAWCAAEELFMEPTDESLKTNLRALIARSEAAFARYQHALADMGA